MNVGWSDPNTYKTQPAKKAQIETTVANSGAATNAQARGATKAVIKGGEHKSKPGSDQTNHVTVEFKKPNGAHVTTKHVNT